MIISKIEACVFEAIASEDYETAATIRDELQLAIKSLSEEESQP